MSERIPKKKVDFFNGGRGVDLSQYDIDREQGLMEEPTSMEDETSNDAYTHGTQSGSEEVSPLYPNSPSDQLSSSSSWNDYAPPTIPYDPQPTTFFPAPTVPVAPIPSYYSSPYCPLDTQTQSTPLSLNLPHHHHQGPGILHRHPHSSTHIPSSIHPSHFTTPPAMFPEPSYGGIMVPPTYSSFRPMDANRLHSMGLGFHDLPHGAEAVPGPSGEGTSGGKKKRQQKCSLCSNHNITVDVKGHKWFCPYRNCSCDRCTITRGRQHHMKEQQKLTRHLQRLH